MRHNEVAFSFLLIYFEHRSLSHNHLSELGSLISGEVKLGS